MKHGLIIILKKFNKSLMKALLVSLFIFCSCVLSSQNRLDEVLETFKKDEQLKHASYSFCVLDAATGKTISEYQSELALIPASTLKIVTTSAALGILGKDYCYKTKFYTATQFDSTLQKNKQVLCVLGSGDPSFGSSYFNKNNTQFINSIVQQLQLNGMKPINGDLIIDNSIFNNMIPDAWIWSDIGNYFGAGSNGLSYNDNKFSIFLNSKSINDEVVINDVKPLFYKQVITITSRVNAFGTQDNAFVYGDPYSFSTRVILGSIPAQKANYEVEAQAPQPQLYFASELSNTLQKFNLQNKNGTYKNISLQSINLKGNQLIYTYSSPNLEKLIYFTNLKSNNHYAESLLNTLGAVKSKQQGTTENGIQAVKHFWKDRGIDVTGLHMVDGSGLSRANTITTKIQATILSKIYRDSSIYIPFNASLPVAGKSGSMTNLCKGTFAENNLRAKTGYINRVRSYCGYVKTKSGKELAFSVIFNNYDCSAKEMKLRLEKLLVALVEL